MQWKNVPMAPVDPILGVAVAYNADPSPSKVNLGIGAYRDASGKPIVLRRESLRLVSETQCKIAQLATTPASGLKASASWNPMPAAGLSDAPALELFCAELVSSESNCLLTAPSLLFHVLPSSLLRGCQVHQGG